jgi:hypothetical protein
VTPQDFFDEEPATWLLWPMEGRALAAWNLRQIQVRRGLSQERLVDWRDDLFFFVRTFMTKSMTKAPKGNTSAAPKKTPAKRGTYPEGYGALRGQFVVRPGLDLTKPIYEQVLELDRKERRKKR